MTSQWMLALGIAACAVVSTQAAARKGPPREQVAAWAACAAERNADDVAWAYILQSDQSGLTGAARDGAIAYAAIVMMRGCMPAETGIDNDLLVALSNQAFAAWKGETGRHSVPRGIDPWADCLAANHPQKARAYLFARDFSFAGPKVIVQGVDPTEAVFEQSGSCDAIKPERSGMDLIDLYARLNYRMRVEPRLRPASAADVGGASK